MMKQFAFGALMGALLLAGASSGHAVPAAHRVYTEKTAHTEISLAYPVTGVPAIDADIRGMIATKAAAFRKEAADPYGDGKDRGVYTDDGDYTIVRNDAKVFSVVWQATEDFQGAHPSHEYWTANYLLPDGWRVFLPEIVDGQRGLARVSAIARDDLDRKLLSGADASGDADWIAKGTAPQATNFEAFMLLPAALRIQFQSYQVDCYACGDPVIDIPMARLAGVLRADWRAPAASFACARAAAPIEQAICSDPLLARADRQVAEIYFEHLGWSKDGSTGVKVDAMRTDQRAFLARRNACMATQAPVPCLLTLYRTRLGELETMTE